MKNNITIISVIQLCDKFIHKNRDWLERIDFVIGVSRGGLIPAVWIATHLNRPLITAYIDKEDKVYIDRGEWIKDKNILIVDDTIRSGKTFTKINKLVTDCEAKEINSFFLLKDFDNEISFPWDIYE